MKVKYGKGTTKYGPGVQIDLDGNEVALAITAWLVANDVFINGARTVMVDDGCPICGGVYVDPSGSVIHKGERFSGRGENKLDKSRKEEK